MKSLNGIWEFDMYGPYGWERYSTAFLKNGKWLAGSKDEYSVGTYTIDGDNLVLSVSVDRYGEKRTMFGRKEPRLQYQFEAKVYDDEIAGEGKMPGNNCRITFQGKRLAPYPFH
jgi:hypothetical protein